jgi:hypothetical protein
LGENILKSQHQSNRQTVGEKATKKAPKSVGGRCRKTITIPIIEEESYEKNVVMYVKLGEPKHIAGKNRGILWRPILNFAST